MQQGITSPAAIEAIMKQFATDLGAAGPRRRVRLRPDQPARGAARHGAGASDGAGPRRHGARAAALLCGVLALLARRAAAQAARPPGRRGEPAVRVRGFGEAGARPFAASQTFDAVLGSSAGRSSAAASRSLCGPPPVRLVRRLALPGDGRARLRLGRRGVPAGHRDQGLDRADRGLGRLALRRRDGAARDPVSSAAASAGTATPRRPSSPTADDDVSVHVRPASTCVGGAEWRAVAGWLGVAGDGRLDGRAGRVGTSRTSAAAAFGEARPGRRSSHGPRRWSAVGRRTGPTRPSLARVLAAVRRIPRGRVATYGDIAALAGRPGRRPRRRQRHAGVRRPLGALPPGHRRGRRPGRLRRLPRT